MDRKRFCVTVSGGAERKRKRMEREGEERGGRDDRKREGISTPNRKEALRFLSKERTLLEQ